MPKPKMLATPQIIYAKSNSSARNFQKIFPAILKMSNRNVNLDVSKESDGGFLLKLPKNVAEKWSNCPLTIEVTLRCVYNMPGQKEHAALSLAGAVVNMEPEEKVHVLEKADVGEQNLGISSQSDASDEEKFAMEGQVVQKLECRPTEDTSYMEMNLDPIRKTAAATRQLQTLEKAVQNFKY